jgi:3'-5' exoribonuclease
LGHIVIGLRILGEKAAQVGNFPPKLRTLLEHMILSHHGELEFGSPKVPLFEEALLLHHLDNLDSKIETMRSALKRETPVDGEFTGWIAPLERSVLRKKRYLVEQQIATVSPQPQTPVPVPPAVAAPPKPDTPRSERPHQSNPQNTLFGEKLQAVLGPRTNT